MFPNYEEAVCLQGRIHLQLFAYKEAENIFRRLIFNQPSSGDYQMLLAESIFGQEKFAECIETCDKIIAKFTNHSYDAMILKIKALIYLNQLDQALLVIQKAG